ncbi:MAG: UPF0280 family protein [Candidatus Hodarchaeota archaeon]
MKPYKYHFSEKESDITIISESKKAILRAKEAFYYHRKILEEYVLKETQFLKSFTPVKVKTDKDIINLMAETAFLCDVGPMATVAGALADLMLEVMKNKNNSDFIHAKIALVENGGEIAIDSVKPMKIALYAGNNELNLNVGFLIEKKDNPIGIGTSSATVGHAISLGEADAVTIFADNATLADGAATAIANLVKGNDIEKSIKKGLDAVDDIEGVRGAFISRENNVGQVGKIPKLIKIEGEKNKILKEKFENLFPGDYQIFK